MKYCKTTTETHPLALAHPQFVEDINTHISDEGYIGISVFTQNETVLDLDEVETIIASIQSRLKNQSMDMTIGLKNDDSSIKEMLLVDFKFRMGNPNNLIQVDMMGKVTGSTNILGPSIQVRNEYIFVFQTNLVEQAINRMARMIPSIHSAYKAMDILTLKATYF